MPASALAASFLPHLRNHPLSTCLPNAARERQEAGTCHTSCHLPPSHNPTSPLEASTSPSSMPRQLTCLNSTFRPVVRAVLHVVVAQACVLTSGHSPPPRPMTSTCHPPLGAPTGTAHLCHHAHDHGTAWTTVGIESASRAPSLDTSSTTVALIPAVILAASRLIHHASLSVTETTGTWTTGIWTWTTHG